MSHKWMKLTFCSFLAVAGCDSSEQFSTYEEAPLSENSPAGHHQHAGAYGGHVIEFDATHAHHAEMLFDEDTRDITLYFYGATIGEGHPAEGLVFELEKGDDELHLDSTPLPLEGETAETSSRFVIAGSEVPPEIKAEDDLYGHFHVTLDGQDFRGSFGHDDHDHSEHGDDHVDHDDHDDHDDDGQQNHGDDEPADGVSGK